MSDDAASERQRRSRDAGVLVMGRLLATLSDALLPLVIVRILGKGEVGVLTSVLLVYNTVALLLATGLPAALMYHLPGRSPEERSALARQMAKGLFGFGVVASAIIAGSGALTTFSPGLAGTWLGADSPAIAQGGLGYLFLLAAFPLGDLPARMLPNLLVLENRTDAAARFAIAKSVGNALFVLVPARFGADISLVILSYSVFGLLQGSVLAHYLRALYPGVTCVAAPIAFRESLRFAVPLGMTDLVSMLNGRFDRYLISATFPIAAFAEYQIGAFQIPVITTVAYTVGTVYTPMLTELLRAGKAREAIEIWRGSIQKVALIVVPTAAVFAVAAEEVITVLFTEDYLRGAPVFRCYALLTMGRVAAFGSVIVAAGKPQLILRSALWTLAANAVLCVVGLELFGFVGPAVGTAVAFVPTVAIYCHAIARATGLGFSEVFPIFAYLKVLATCAAAALPAVLVKVSWSAPPALQLVAIALTLLSGFALLGTLVGLITRNDWAYALRFLRLRAPQA